MVQGSHPMVSLCTEARVFGSKVAAFPHEGGDAGRAPVDGCVACALERASG